MISVSVTPFKAVDKAYYRIKPNKSEFNYFKYQSIGFIEIIRVK